MALSRYHLLVAENFLRNISLDGSHKDTSLRMFDQIGLPLQHIDSENIYDKQMRYDEDMVGNEFEESLDYTNDGKWSMNADIKLTLKQMHNKIHTIDVIQSSLSASQDSLTGSRPITPITQSTGQRKFFMRFRTVGYKNERLCLCSSESNAPLALFSIIRYGQKPIAAFRSEKMIHSNSLTGSIGIRPIELMERQEISYKHLVNNFFIQKRFNTVIERTMIHKRGTTSTIETHSTAQKQHPPRANSCESPNIPHSTETGDESPSRSFLYDPNLLDSSDFEYSNRKTTMRFPGYVASVMDYMEKTNLKRQLNDSFKQRFPFISLTYSKFKSLKREMTRIARECELDSVTLAHAFVFFEKIVFKGLITKANRKLIAGVSLLLSVKINDIRSTQLANVIEKTESIFRLNCKDLMQYEIPVCVALEFNLNVADGELFPHYQKLELVKL